MLRHSQHENPVKLKALKKSEPLCFVCCMGFLTQKCFAGTAYPIPSIPLPHHSFAPSSYTCHKRRSPIRPITNPHRKSLSMRCEAHPQTPSSSKPAKAPGSFLDSRAINAPVNPELDAINHGWNIPEDAVRGYLRRWRSGSARQKHARETVNQSFR
jgi:hypothetical protein